MLFDIIQRICLVFGYGLHKKCVDTLNLIIILSLKILGTTFDVSDTSFLKKNQSYIIVSNHQSAYDIPPIIWFLRSLHPKFISKKSLGRGIPSISFNLRNGGSILIDRTNNEESIEKIKNLGITLSKLNRSVVIFPEGTRSKSSKPKKFKHGGITKLMESMPNAYLLGITINNSWKINKNGLFPLSMGTNVKLKVHKPIKFKNKNFKIILNKIENKIFSAIET